MTKLGVAWLLLWIAWLPPSFTQNIVPGPALDCCEGDILLLLDSSGSISSYEFSRLLHFLVDLLRPFLLGPDRVRVGLVQVGTEPHLEFHPDTYSSQDALRDALLRTQQLQGNTNTEAALLLAQRLLRQPQGSKAPPRVLLWLTDGVEPGDIDGPMAELRQEGVSVLAVSTGHASYNILRSVVTPPSDSHLHFVDIDDIGIIEEELREAIIELIRADRLQVRSVGTHNAVLQWRPVLLGTLGHYEVRYGPDDASTNTLQYRTLPEDQSWTELTELQPNTLYRAWLRTHTHLGSGRMLTASFTTLPDVLSPVTVTVSESGPDRVRVSWAPLQPHLVQRYLVEYGAITGGDVRTVMLSGYEDSALLTHLHPDTQYLITVTAVHSSGRERAMSVRACTQEALPALTDLQLTQVGRDSVKVDWRSQAEGAGLQGYWVSWESSSSSYSSLRYLPRHSVSTILTHLSPASRVCVSPVYRTARGEGLCCTAHGHAVASGATWE